MRIKALSNLAVVVSLALQVPAHAQFSEKSQPDLSLDATTTANLIAEIAKTLRASYIFPETAEKMSQDLQSRLEKKDYDQITSAKQLAETLTEQLQAISKDKHLRVSYSHRLVPQPSPDEEQKPGLPRKPEELAKARAHGAASKFGFEKVDVLEGNIGYIDLRGFHPAELGGQVAADSMNAIANTDALIIDLRKNGGGAPSMVALLCSYLLPADPVHLNDQYNRKEDRTHQWWTLPYVPGSRYESKPVYLLTSQRTFSAAEEFAYNLKNLKRATIIGETTGGGAHPGRRQRLGDHFFMFVPTGRSINPITKSNWEGTGVSPDVAVPADRALKTAHLAALKELIPQNEARIERIKKTRASLEQELQGTEQAGK